MPALPAETVARFVVDETRARRGRLWDEGRRPVALGPAPPPAAEALTLLAARRVRGVPHLAVRALLGWAAGERRAELLERVPAAGDVLERQARGRRCVSVVSDAAARAHGDPRHPDGLSFVLHDLCHLEKFAAPEHHAGQVGFFGAVAGALSSPALCALERGFDALWRADRDYVSADMNGCAVFLFAILKMRLNMAVRRRLAAERGRPQPTRGALDDEERAAVQPALATLVEALALPPELRASAAAISARREHPADARLLLDHFEREGARRLGLT